MIKKNITLQDIADSIGVSRVHVARAIFNKGYVKESLKKEILEKAGELNYSLNSNARALVSKKSMNIAFFMETAESYYSTFSPMMHLVRYFSEAIESRGYRLQLPSPDVRISLSKASMPDGIIIGFANEKLCAKIKKEYPETPLAAFCKKSSTWTSLLEKNNIPHVAFDNAAGLMRLAELAGKKSMKRICILNSRGSNLPNTEPVKITEMKNAFSRYGISISQANIFNIERRTEELTLQILKYMPELCKYDLCILGSEFIAMYFYQAAAIAGVKIPGDISLACYDNPIYATSLNPPLSSISFSYKEVAEKTTDLLMSIISNNHENHKTCEIIAADFCNRKSIRA